MSYAISLIDDQLPITSSMTTQMVDKEYLSKVAKDENWNDFSMQGFVQQTIKNVNKFKISSFNAALSPGILSNFRKEKNFEPNVTVLDWDLGGIDTEKSVDELLSETSSKIYILTGNELEDDVIRILEPKKANFSERGLKVFSKSIYPEVRNTQEDLVEEIFNDYTHIPQEKTYSGRKITFYPSYILPISENLWFVESILSRSFLFDFLDNNSNIISQELIEKMFEESNIKIYANEQSTRIYSKNGLELSKMKKDELHEIKPVYAIKNFDLAILETAFEKGYSKVFR